MKHFLPSISTRNIPIYVLKYNFINTLMTSFEYNFPTVHCQRLFACFVVVVFCCCFFVWAFVWFCLLRFYCGGFVLLMLCVRVCIYLFI